MRLHAAFRCCRSVLWIFENEEVEKSPEVRSKGLGAGRLSIRVQGDSCRIVLQNLRSSRESIQNSHPKINGSVGARVWRGGEVEKT